MTWLSDAAIDRLRSAAGAPPSAGERYELREPIGRGGMATVYRASDRELGREVAVKVMHATESEAEGAARLVREARVIARLEHPGLVPVHDVGTGPDGRVFYVMKLVRGRRLDEHFATPGPLDERLRIFERICEPVAFAHARGVIHRDLKPQNIMVGGFGEVLVLDWGVAKLRAGSLPAVSEAPAPGGCDAPLAEQETCTRYTAHGTIIGTPAYMSPEQARGDSDQVDERSDVFALGAILYFLLTGEAPTTRSVLERRSGAPPETADLWSAGLRRAPQPLAAICRRALAATPEERYSSASDLAAEIARFRAGQRVHAHREGVLGRVRRVSWKYATPILLVLAYLLMRAVLVFFK